MKQKLAYASVINEANEISTEYLKSSDSIKRIELSKKELIKDMERNSFIKVPFVGDFNAGKSSLINAMMGKDLLPTDIVPTTAVSYELYYSTDEKLEIYHKDQLKGTASFDEISKLDVRPGDIVYVYINNDFVKQMNDRGIVVVDMPGIDSGIEEHNNAILSYIGEGSFFFLVTAAEQGALRHSAIRFVDELKKYNLTCNVIISKSDQKTESELEKIKEEIAKTAKSVIREDIEVALASAVEKRFDDVKSMLLKLDAEAIFANKFSQQVKNFVSEIASELGLQIKLALSDKKDFSQKIELLIKEKEKALESLKEKEHSAQSLSGSVQDILDDIREAIIAKSQYLAQLVFSKQDSNALNEEVLSIIRPILFNSLKREVSEYQDVIGDGVKEFSISINDILTDKDNKIVGSAEKMWGDIVSKEILEKFLKKGLDQLAKKVVAYKSLSIMLKGLSKSLGPVITVIINIIPDIFKFMFGKSSEQKIEAIREKIVSGIVNKIIENLRSPITEMLEEQRNASMLEMERIINEETKKIDDNIRLVQQEEQASEEEISAKVKNLETGINRLNGLIANI